MSFCSLLFTLTLVSFVFTGVSAVAIDQEVLKPTGSDLSDQPLSIRLEKFYTALRALPIDVRPPFEGCYHRPGPYNKALCDSFTLGNWKTNDNWTSDQPGGYFYVCFLLMRPVQPNSNPAGQLGILSNKWGHMRHTNYD